MLKVNFCYVISEEAGMAYDANGEDAKAYVKASFNVKEPLSVEEHLRMHEVVMLNNIANQLGIEPEFFTAITYEEYLRDADEEDDCE